MSRVPRPRIHDDDLRRRLLEVAATTLADQGPHRLTLRSVAAAAGTSTSAIYSLFGSKAVLLRGLYVEGFSRFAAALNAVPGRDELGPMDRLDALFEAYLEFAFANPSFYGMMFGKPLPDLDPTEEEVAAALGTLQVLIDALQDAVDEGHLTGPADEGAMELWATTHGVAALAIAGMLGEPEEAAAFGRAAARTMLAGLATPRPTGAGATRPTLRR